MQMKMKHCLTCCLTIIDTYIVAIWCEFLIKHYLGFLDRAADRHLLLFCYIEEGSNVALWDNEGMPRGYRKAVTHCQCVIALVDNPLARKITKQALSHITPHFISNFLQGSVYTPTQQKIICYKMLQQACDIHCQSCFTTIFVNR